MDNIRLAVGPLGFGSGFKQFGHVVNNTDLPVSYCLICPKFGWVNRTAWP